MVSRGVLHLPNSAKWKRQRVHALCLSDTNPKSRGNDREASCSKIIACHVWVLPKSEGMYSQKHRSTGSNGRAEFGIKRALGILHGRWMELILPFPRSHLSCAYWQLLKTRAETLPQGILQLCWQDWHSDKRGTSCLTEEGSLGASLSQWPTDVGGKTPGLPCLWTVVQWPEGAGCIFTHHAAASSPSSHFPMPLQLYKYFPEPPPKEAARTQIPKVHF